MRHDGPAALEAADEFRPDVVLLDIGLPGMDGYEVARRLREPPRRRRARAGRADRLRPGRGPPRSREAGFDHHLVKPVDLDTLSALFEAHRGLAGDAAGPSVPTRAGSL